MAPPPSVPAPKTGASVKAGESPGCLSEQCSVDSCFEASKADALTEPRYLLYAAWPCFRAAISTSNRDRAGLEVGHSLPRRLHGTGTEGMSLRCPYQCGKLGRPACKICVCQRNESAGKKIPCRDAMRPLTDGSCMFSSAAHYTGKRKKARRRVKSGL